MLGNGLTLGGGVPVEDEEDNSSGMANIDVKEMNSWNDDAILQSFEHAMRTYREKGEPPSALEENAVLLKAIAMTCKGEESMNASSSASSSSSSSSSPESRGEDGIAAAPLPSDWQTVPHLTEAERNLKAAAVAAAEAGYSIPTSLYDQSAHGDHASNFSGSTILHPPLPRMETHLRHAEQKALSDLLLSWYNSGYHMGRYQAMIEFRNEQVTTKKQQETMQQQKKEDENIVVNQENISEATDMNE